MENLERLILELIKYPEETPWFEFKHNNWRPDMIGEDISALANSAALYEKPFAYMLWGIDNKTHEIVGTDFNLQTCKKGQQELESWLRIGLSQNADYGFHTVKVNNNSVGVLKIHKAENQTVMFNKVDYIRIGSYTKKLNEFSSVQAKVWDKLRNARFEEQLAKENLLLNDALQLLDYSSYFDIMGIPLPSDMERVSHYMLEEKILIKQDSGLFAITNLGALLFGKKLSDYSRLSRKATRVIQYRGNNRLQMLKEDVVNKGYAVGFEGLMKFIEALIPSEEIISGALREKETAYPMLVIREAVANALIHQDFSITGTGPVVEIFDSRIEITNSGTSLVNINRIIDNPPKSRNEQLASLMRRLRMCEELGTGWDKMVIKCEVCQLPAPKMDLYEESTKVTLYSQVPYTNLPAEDKLRACYMHACVMYVQNEQLTNTSLRNRFGLKESSSGSVSRLIKDAVEKGLIKPLDPTTAPRYMKYIPAWA